MLKMSEMYLEPTRTSTMEFENDPNFLPVKKGITGVRKKTDLLEVSLHLTNIYRSKIFLKKLFA